MDVLSSIVVLKRGKVDNERRGWNDANVKAVTSEIGGTGGSFDECDRFDGNIHTVDGLSSPCGKGHDTTYTGELDSKAAFIGSNQETEMSDVTKIDIDSVTNDVMYELARFALNASIAGLNLNLCRDELLAKWYELVTMRLRDDRCAVTLLAWLMVKGGEFFCFFFF